MKEKYQEPKLIEYPALTDVTMAISGRPQGGKRADGGVSINLLTTKLKVVGV